MSSGLPEGEWQVGAIALPTQIFFWHISQPYSNQGGRLCQRSRIAQKSGRASNRVGIIYPPD